MSGRGHYGMRAVQAVGGRVGAQVDVCAESHEITRLDLAFGDFDSALLAMLTARGLLPFTASEAQSVDPIAAWYVDHAADPLVRLYVRQWRPLRRQLSVFSLRTRDTAWFNELPAVVGAAWRHLGALWQQAHRLGIPVPPPQGLVVRGSYARSRVGAPLAQGASERDAFAAQIDDELTEIVKATARALGADPTLITTTTSLWDWREQLQRATPAWRQRVIDSQDAMQKSPLAGKLRPFFDRVSAVKNEWSDFYRDNNLNSTWFGTITTGWDLYNHWFDRVEALRKQAESLGVQFVSPPSDRLSKSDFDNLKGGVGDVLDTVKSVLKTAGWVALGIGGLWGVSKIAQAGRR